MDSTTIDVAIQEAKRFIERAETYVAIKKKTSSFGYTPATAESSAARRASMDLTRALAAMRKPT